MNDRIEGKHPVKEVLAGKRKVIKLYLQNSRDRSIEEIGRWAQKKQIPIDIVDRKTLDEMAEGRNHQGVIAEVAPFEYADLEVELVKKEGPRFILALDGVEDPHNLGSIIRSADAAGVDFVMIKKRRAASVTPVVAKTSAGAVESVPVVQVTNMTRALERVKEAGAWVYGTDLEGEILYDGVDLSGSVCLVIGNEGEGLTRLVRETCDFLVKLPMLGKVQSLNASVAAGLVLYEVVRQRHAAGRS